MSISDGILHDFDDDDRHAVMVMHAYAGRVRRLTCGSFFQCA